jgi:aerobic carbon-monoxide dehydrogenase large subunit
MSVESQPPAGFFGRSVLRLEDRKLLRGAGRFVDDIDLPGVLHAAFVRSPIAHGRIARIDAATARAADGVHAVLTYADLRPLITCDRIPLALPSAAIRFDVDPVWLADARSAMSASPWRWWWR